MKSVRLTIPSDSPHICQIITGFLRLDNQDWQVEIRNLSSDRANPFYGLPMVLAEYRGKRIVYDLGDGYQNPEGMAKGLSWGDFYFKRSFSDEKNKRMFFEKSEIFYPLGFNYYMTHPQNPIHEPQWKALMRLLLGRTPDRYFVPEVFEETAVYSDAPAKILFLTRLWDDGDITRPEAVNEERRFINETRISILRALRSQYQENFIGGLKADPLSRKLAPELILNAKYTERKQYLKLLHSCNICIGSMGLHESIGWKTGEYVAAAKAIVNERLHYTVPGDFVLGKNYLHFETAEQCVEAVSKLVNDPDARYAMSRANEAYYQNYLKPEVLVKNTLDIVDQKSKGRQVLEHTDVQQCSMPHLSGYAK